MKLLLVFVPVMLLLLACSAPASPAPSASPPQPSQNVPTQVSQVAASQAASTRPAALAATATSPAVKYAPTAVALPGAGPVPEGLLDAVVKGDLETVKKLLPAGSPVDVVSEKGDTPLMAAAGAGQLDVMRYLLDQGAALDAGAASDRATPLIVAAYYKKADAAKLLVERGANVNLAADGGLSALHLAADGGQEELAKTLLGAGADPNVLTTRGLDPLFLALRMQYVPVTRLLLDHGADANAVYTHEQPYPNSPLGIAAWTGNDEIIKMLVDKGARIPWLGEVPGFDPYDFQPLDVSFKDGQVRVSGGSQPLFLGASSVVRPWKDPKTMPEDRTGTNFFTWTDRGAHDPVTVLVLQDERGHKTFVDLVLPVYLGKEGVDYGEGVTQVTEGGPFVILRVHAAQGAKGKVILRRGDRRAEQEIGADGIATFEIRQVGWNEPLAIDLPGDSSGTVETIDVDCIFRSASAGGVIYESYLKAPGGDAGK